METPIIKFESEKFIETETYLDKSLTYFFKELQSCCEINEITDFEEWFLERTYLSVFINGLIRNDKENKVYGIQEYTLKHTNWGGSGRCDALLKINDDGFLLESKLQTKPKKVGSDHWDTKSWETYDTTDVFSQLNDYYISEEEYFNHQNRYKSFYLQTIVFKIVSIMNIEEHIKGINSLENKKFEENRKWYYSFFKPSFLADENIGIEVYGSILKVK